MITLRELTSGDVPAVQHIYSKASVRFTHAQPYTIKQASDRVGRALAAAAERPRNQWDFGAVRDQELIGLVSLRLRGPGHGTLSYILRQDTWGHGYATEAARQASVFAVTALGLDCLEAKHHPGNLASGRVLVKVGFTQVGHADLPGKGGTVSYPVYCLRRPAVGSSTDRLR
ncbi:GNAT family N-acetyltransferase [Streptomyces exfoliatus]|uniref:GNAT family N-acetyltransferase n=1 Tax=Streptomyces exfoliatus TaxID=1905 RepID=UPI000465D140|nr:GNAT family N-acetyltransferase [Streptomyces exfoliatus]